MIDIIYHMMFTKQNSNMFKQTKRKTKLSLNMVSFLCLFSSLTLWSFRSFSSHLVAVINETWTEGKGAQAFGVGVREREAGSVRLFQRASGDDIMDSLCIQWDERRVKIKESRTRSTA
ncbi:hypothetical protein HPP92_010401 [Vanilla planifolia]|uniref:Uncharacterized protein n=1 Tax=Vanilla planifolia TaxID=51239 RepID=A0A835V1S8_VANPL|nr:hypothetical protein HPP92_010693 [Vanilla planifolia]KAG0482317.1 hypothetical protein HPP92_010401 [Vanilla planifolia]